MADMIAAGEAWFEQKRRDHLSVVADYTPTVGIPRTVRATAVIGRWESMDAAGQILRTETRDFFVHVDDLSQDPKKGDRLVLTENGTSVTYEVMIPSGAQHHWQWADRRQTIRRIHTMVVAETSGTAGTLLVRAIGSSTAAAITDEQIVSQLALDLSTGRAMSRTVTAAAAYVYVVLPDSFGTPTFTINGLPVTAWTLTTRSITFDGQAATPYRVYRSTYPITGTVLVEVT
jgi:hypothetical protein